MSKKPLPFRRGSRATATAPEDLAQQADLRRYPEYVAVLEELELFERKMREHKRREAELVEAIAADAHEDRDAGMMRRALALVRNEEAPRADVEGLRRELARVRDDMRALKSASEQKGHELARVRAKLARKICEDLKGNHDQLVATVVATLVSAAQALEAERVFRQTLARQIPADVFLKLPEYPFELAEILDLKGHDSPIKRLIAAAQKHGQVAAGEVPKSAA